MTPHRLLKMADRILDKVMRVFISSGSGAGKTVRP
jgi:hypothetical protein